MENKKRTTIRSSWLASRIVVVIGVVADICAIVDLVLHIIP